MLSAVKSIWKYMGSLKNTYAKKSFINNLAIVFCVYLSIFMGSVSAANSFLKILALICYFIVTLMNQYTIEIL